MFGQRSDPGLSAALANAHRLPTGQQRPSLQIPRQQHLKVIRGAASASATATSTPFSLLFANSTNLPPKAPPQVYRSPPRMERPREGYDVSQTQDADDGCSTYGDDDRPSLSGKGQRKRGTPKRERSMSQSTMDEKEQQLEDKSRCCNAGCFSCSTRSFLSCFVCCRGS